PQTGGNARNNRVRLQPAYIYNPGLVSSWFVVTGILGMLLIMNGSLTASTMMVKEREAGTLEQLLMTPAGTADIIIAKIAPLLMLLSMMGCFAVFLMRVIFGVPFRGSVALVVAGAMVCILAGIGIGTSIATFSKSTRQAFLTTFFVTPPLSSLSGAFMPVEAMPGWMQPLTILNPIYHFGRISRGALIKGSGFGTLWPNLAVLLVFALALFSMSVWRFRKQLS